MIVGRTEIAFAWLGRVCVATFREAIRRWRFRGGCSLEMLRESRKNPREAWNVDMVYVEMPQLQQQKNSRFYMKYGVCCYEGSTEE